jgi:hypothetical protein
MPTFEHLPGQKHSNKSRARQQWKPSQARFAAEEKAQRWRRLTEQQRRVERMDSLLGYLLSELRHEALATSTGILVDWQAARMALERAQKALEAMQGAKNDQPDVSTPNAPENGVSGL